MNNILIITAGLTAGGVDNLLLNLLEEIDKEQYHIDFLIFDYSRDDWAYKFKKYGSKIYKIDRAHKQGVRKSIGAYRDIIRQGNYKIVHSQIGFGGILPLIACQQIRGCHFIAHSHFDNYPVHRGIKIVGRFLFHILPCKRLACSMGAGKELYGKHSRFVFLKNGIDVEKYCFSESVQLEERKKLGYKQSDFVIGTVGRIEYQKNYEFMIEMFSYIKKRIPNAKLLLVGDGSLRCEMEKLVAEKKLIDVRFTGSRNDVDKLLQIMDVFVMPTRYEGLSMSLLEVQASGLPCLTSTCVPKEVKVVKDFHFLDLSKGTDFWAQEAMKYLHYIRKDAKKEIIDAGFDRHSALNRWIDVYEQLI